MEIYQYAYPQYMNILNEFVCLLVKSCIVYGTQIFYIYIPDNI